MVPAPGELSDLRGRRAQHPDRDRTEMVYAPPSLARGKALKIHVRGARVDLLRLLLRAREARAAMSSTGLGRLVAEWAFVFDSGSGRTLAWSAVLVLVPARSR